MLMSEGNNEWIVADLNILMFQSSGCSRNLLRFYTANWMITSFKFRQEQAISVLILILYWSICHLTDRKIIQNNNEVTEYSSFHYFSSYITSINFSYVLCWIEMAPHTGPSWNCSPYSLFAVWKKHAMTSCLPVVRWWAISQNHNNLEWHY